MATTTNGEGYGMKDGRRMTTEEVDARLAEIDARLEEIDAEDARRRKAGVPESRERIIEKVGEIQSLLAEADVLMPM